MQAGNPKDFWHPGISAPEAGISGPQKWISGVSVPNGYKWRKTIYSLPPPLELAASSPTLSPPLMQSFEALDLSL
jgi:hypothetical protein